jgi:tetratricopeptide (TPR) repeat protein
MARNAIRSFGLALILAALLLPPLRVGAEGAPPDSETGSSATPAFIPPEALPGDVLLDGFRMVWQQVNRCAAAALTIQLYYYEWDGTYQEVINYLNPHMDDVSVRPDEKAAFVEQHDLRSVWRMGGDKELLKQLVANGFPVLLEMVYYDGPSVMNDWMRHKRVIMGYDNEKEVFYTIDSLLGAGPEGTGREIEYDGFDERWQPFNRNYFVIYRPEEEELLQAVLGDHWDPNHGVEQALIQAETDIAGPGSNSFAHFSRGTSLVMLERYEEAAEAFDQARAIGLPMRMMWYQFGPFEAYLALERYDDVIELARYVIGTTPGVEEAYYYIALAYSGQGNLDRAEANLRVALQRNTNFTQALETLEELREEINDA